MSATAALKRLLVAAITVASLLWPPTTRATASQVITFNPIGNRTTGQALSFTVAPSATSGLPVSLAATGSCEVSSLNVSVLDKGTCTLTATQAGNEEWTAATPVTQSFTISRVLLSNKTLTFKTADGQLAIGLKVKWTTPDRSFSSTAIATTNSAGQVKYSKIPGGTINLELMGNAGKWTIPYGRYWEAYAEQSVVVGPGTSTITVGPRLDQYPIDLRLKVQLADGQPVPNAMVVAMDGWKSYRADTFGHELCSVDYWQMVGCIDKTATNSNGEAIFKVPVSERAKEAGMRAEAQFADGDLAQSSPSWGNNFVGNALTIVFDQLPVVEMEIDAATVNYAATQMITAVARDSEGSPIAGQVLTLSSSSSSASASCTGCSRTATTDSSGVATFKVRPIKTATWSVDGRSIVGSTGVKITVQLTPTAPRTLVCTPNARSMSLTWVAPVNANASAVTDYIVQYRLQGSGTWVNFRDGASTARKATVTGIIKGRVYEFRIAAKNKAGTGTWSEIGVGTPR